MKKYLKAYKIKDGIHVKVVNTFSVFSETGLRDYCRQNGMKLKPQFYGRTDDKIISYYAE